LWDPIYETAAKVYMMKDIGKKWKENMLKLFCTYYDDKKSRDENVKNPPLSIPETEWATFIDYRLKENTKVFSYSIFIIWLPMIIEFILCVCVFVEYVQKEC